MTAPERLAADFGLLGRQLRARRVGVDAGQAAAFLERRRGERRIRRKPASLIAAGASTIWFAGEYREASSSFWIGAGSCSDQAATTIWLSLRPGPGRRRDGQSRPRLWLWASSIARFAIERAAAARSGSRMFRPNVALTRHACSHVRVDAWRPRARRAPRLRIARLRREHDLTHVRRAFGAFLEAGRAPRAARSAPVSSHASGRRRPFANKTSCFFDGARQRSSSPRTKPEAGVERASECSRGLATATGRQRVFDAELHRARGEMLLERIPPTPRLRRTRSWPPSQSRSSKARAVSNCARRSRSPSSISRPAAPLDAHAVLAPALEGFAPTPEMPEIAEAQALLAALAKTRRGQGRNRAAAAADAIACGLRQRAHRGARLWRAGNDGSLRASPPVGVRRTGCARTPGG